MEAGSGHTTFEVKYDRKSVQIEAESIPMSHQ